MRFARFIGWAGVVMSGLLVTSMAAADDREINATIDRPPPPVSAVQRPTRQDMNLDMRTPLQTYAMRPRRVNERYTRDLGNGCDYVATVRGHLQPREERRRHEGPTYRSDLTLDAHVECAGHVTATAPMYRLRGGHVREADLRQALSAHGRISTRVSDRTCQLTPSFVVADNRVETRAVWQSCGVTPAAIGGGPRR